MSRRSSAVHDRALNKTTLENVGEGKGDEIKWSDAEIVRILSPTVISSARMFLVRVTDLWYVWFDSYFYLL